SFGDAQRLRVRLSIAAQPRLVVISRTLDDKGFAVPTPHRVSHPAWPGVGLQLSAVRENHAIGEVVVQDRDGGRRLQDALPGSTPSVGLRPARQTLIGGTRLKVFLPTLTDEIVDPRLRTRRVEAGFGYRSVPDSSEVSLAIGRTRRRRSEVGLAVGFAW